MIDFPRRQNFSQIDPFFFLKELKIPRTEPLIVNQKFSQNKN
jgi:hypothetical protein